jgi:hypothetical protein
MSLTPLSHPKPRKTKGLGWIRGLARLSLSLGIMASLAAGCVVSDPPEYGLAKRTPPFLDLNGADPKVFERLDVQPGSVRALTVPFRSEDAGDSLIAQLYLDYNISINEVPQERLQAFNNLQPSTLDDEAKRTVDFNWNVPVTKGCYQLTMVLTHSQNLDRAKPIDFSDVAFAIWWVNVGDSDSSNLVNCPPNGGGA